MVGWHHRLNGHELSKRWKTLEDREAWRAVVHGVTKSWTWLNNSTTTIVNISAFSKGFVMKVLVTALPPTHPIVLGPIPVSSCMTDRQIWPQKFGLTNELLCARLNKKSPITRDLDIQIRPNGCESF